MPRRLSWKTAVQRRNRPSSSCPSTEQPPNSNSYHLQQLNPYKLSSSLRNSAGASSHASSIQDGNYERNVNVAPVRRSKGSESNATAGSFDSDSLGADDDLDNILSGISDAVEVVVDTTVEKKSISPDTPICSNDEHDRVESCPKSSANQTPRPVDLASISSAQTDLSRQNSKTGLRTSCNSIQQEDNSNTGKILAVIDFDPINKQDNDDSEQDSLLEPIASCSQKQETFNIKLDPIEGRALPSSVPLLHKGIDGATAVDAAEMHESRNIFGVVHHHHNQPDDTISTVTDQTDSPFIFTYQKSHDDDSVSQITSSIAPSLASLKNIPFAAPSGGLAQNRLAANRNPPLWMGGSARTNTRKRGAVFAGTFGRDRVRHPVTSEGGGGKSARNADASCHSNLDEIEYALNAGSVAQRSRRSKQDISDLSTIESEKSGLSRRRSLECLDVKSGISALGMGGASCMSRSMTHASGLLNPSSSRGLIECFVILARKAQHHATRFFFPTPPKVTQRKKFDRSDSLDDLLLEEGAKTLPHWRGNTHNDDGKDDIDYFSRAMSTSSYGSFGARSQGSSHGSLQQKPSFARIFTCGTIFLILIALKYYSASTAAGIRGKSKTNPRSRVNDVSAFHVQDFEERGGRTFGVDIRSDYERVAPQVRHQAELEEFDEPPIERGIPGTDRIGEDTNVSVVLGNVADLDAGPFQKGNDVPFYWHVPRSGGGTINDVLGSCLELVLASDAGGSGEFGQEQTLRVVHFSRHLSFVNVDAYSPKGIQRAKSLNLVTSKLADVVMSPLLHDAAALFTPTHKGRMFTLLRNPIERAASLFYFIQETQWKRPETRNDQFADITIENFYKQGLAENNWMTRFLTNQLAKGELVEEDLELAKHILKRKFLIGLLEEKAESFKRFQKYFGWKAPDESCIEKKIEWTWPMKHRHSPVKNGSEAWNLIHAQNMYDMKLYEYAKELFVEQQSFIPK